MAQIKFKADLDVAQYPLLFSAAPRTVVQDAPDGSSPYNRPPINHPQIMFAKDVLPTKWGYKSVGYKQLVPAATVANLSFTQEHNVTDPSQNKGLLGVTSDNHIYLLTAASPNWVDVTPVGWGGGDAVTHAIVNGQSYIYLGSYGCYLVNIATVALTVQALTGITAGAILGCTGAVNYLILWDAAGYVYWSSTTNPFDFVPSLITGAGREIPADLNGKIIICIPLNNGFAIYSTRNIVLASFSNNTQYPWIMRNANGSSGIDSYKKVSLGHDLGYHVAATFAGILQVTSQGCTTIVPEVADFLAANIYESYDSVNNAIIINNLPTPLAYRLTIIGARWTILSFGEAAATGVVQQFTDAFVYDSILKKWGKLSATHTCIFELNTNMEGVILPYNQASEIGQTYAAASPQTYNSTNITLNSPPQVGRIIGLLAADGTISVVTLDYNSINQNSVLWLGKFQATRDYNLVMEELLVEDVDSTNTNFSLLDIPSYNGRDLNTPVIPTVLEQGDQVRRYGLRSEAQNHIIALLGSFDLSTLLITATLGGRR